MNFLFKIVQSIFFFARTRARIYRSLISSLLFLVVQTHFSYAQTSPFILGQDSRIHGVRLDHTQESATRNTMGISGKCGFIKKQSTALPLIGSEGALIDANIKSTRGLLVLEGLRPSGEPKILNTRFLSPYLNYPTSIPGETVMMPGSRYPFAITLAATLAGNGDLVFQAGDRLIIHTDGQLYSYALPQITIPSNGLLRLYLGTDDTLYYDAALTHPVHSGPCRSNKK